MSSKEGNSPCLVPPALRCNADLFSVIQQDPLNSAIAPLCPLGCLPDLLSLLQASCFLLWLLSTSSAICPRNFLCTHTAGCSLHCCNPCARCQEQKQRRGSLSLCGGPGFLLPRVFYGRILEIPRQQLVPLLKSLAVHFVFPPEK